MLDTFKRFLISSIYFFFSGNLSSIGPLCSFRYTIFPPVSVIKLDVDNTELLLRW